VFAALDAEEFQSCFITWIKAVYKITQGEVVAIDGWTISSPEYMFYVRNRMDNT
jgi:hypothetical protein